MSRGTNNRVLLVVADGSPGGGTTAVLALAEGLVDNGWDVSLVTQARSYAAERAEALGLDTIALNFFKSRVDPMVHIGLRRAIQKTRPSIIHAHGGRAAAPLCLMPDLVGKRAFIYTVHGFHFRAKRPVARELGRAVEWAIARLADAVIYVGDSDRSLAIQDRVISQRPLIIRNGVELEPRSEERPKDFDIIFSGRMHAQKNPLFALEVLSAMERPELSLLMVGGGELEAVVQARSKALNLTKQVEFTGALARWEALDRVSRSKVFLFPSLWEGLPFGPIEALAHGVPVVGSRIPGTMEVVEDGLTGRLIDGFNAKEYAGVVGQILDDEILRNRLGANGRRVVEERFSLKRNIDLHLALYARLLPGGSAGLA